MRQALHIFRKDAWHFRHEIAVSVAFTAAFAFSRILGGPSFLIFVGRAVPFIWWLFICPVIQEDSLAGDKQFWITRPYSRASLVAAKALFIVAFINAPLLLAQFAILTVAGFQPLAYLPSFLWVHIVFFASVLLPAVALSSVTRNLGQAVLVLFGVTAALIVVGLAISGLDGQTNYGSYPFAWAGNLIEEISFAAVALLILILQWTFRMRWLALSAGVAFYLVFGLFSGDLPVALATSVQSRMFGERAAEQTAVTMNGSDLGRASTPSTRQRVPVSIGFRIVNLPAGLLAKPEIVDLIFDDQHGAHWSSGWIPSVNATQLDPDPDGVFAWSQIVWVDRRFAQRVGSAPLTVHGSVWVMLNERRGIDVPVNRRTSVPQGGSCTVYTQSRKPAWWVVCSTPFHAAFFSSNNITVPTERGTATRTITRLLSFWDSPLPSTMELSPLSQNADGGVGVHPEILYFYYQPRAWIRRYFTATNVRLP